ncbi:gastrula zinc finger protein XlCGF49.1-like [Pseudorasbora parva]|uniref:gastrula zinc finger protein XlCGF49.1-like n=1 Tax=Pseudorasbora parva TaxID=51549 RepID=UPI00351EE998
MTLREESEVRVGMEEQDHYEKKLCDFTNGEQSTETEKARSNSHFTCHQCGKSFTEKGSLKNHMRVHTGDRPYTQYRPQCELSFSKKNLYTHIRIHTGEQPFTCPQCGRGFTHKGSLNDHMNTHTREKPFICPQCGKRFTQNQNRRVHICKQCGKSFLREEIPEAQIGTNTGASTLTCQQICHHMCSAWTDFHT